MSERRSTISRATAETRIELHFVIDGSGASRISTGVGALDHFLTLFARHGLFDLDLRVTMVPGLPPKLTLDIGYRDGTATFAGHLDPQTRRRLGFDYPLERGHGIGQGDVTPAGQVGGCHNHATPRVERAG